MTAALPLLVVLTGPTGTGKSELALQLADTLASQRPIEIVSVDSALVYRGMDIGTAKPDASARTRIVHHLIDIRDPAHSYSAGDFVRDARQAIDAIILRGHLPLLVGGTMLYLRALYQGLAPLPQASNEVRAQLNAQALAEGWHRLHAQLALIDPDAAAHIAPTDAQRIQRALEVYQLTGVPISRWQQRTRGASHDYRWLRYALFPDSRADLRQHLAARFQAMLQAGLVEEVRALQARADLTATHASMRAVGYRQLWGYCRGQCTLEEASRLAVTATAQLAKRQLTWMRRERGMCPLAAHTAGQAASIGSAIQAVW